MGSVRRTSMAMIHHLAGVCTGMFALVALPVLCVSTRFARWFAGAERWRFGFLLDTDWPSGSLARSRVVRYALLRLPVSLVTFTVSYAIWTVAAVLVALPAYNELLPAGGANLGGRVVSEWWTLPPAALGLVLLFVARWITLRLAGADVAISRRLLRGDGSGEPRQSRAGAGPLAVGSFLAFGLVGWIGFQVAGFAAQASFPVSYPVSVAGGVVRADIVGGQLIVRPGRCPADRPDAFRHDRVGTRLPEHGRWHGAELRLPDPVRPLPAQRHARHPGRGQP
jgi:hypothetical protein